MKDRICLVVSASTFSEFMLLFERAQKSSQLLELRIDCINDINPQHLAHIAERLTVTAIVTCRSQQHGGRFNGSMAAQNALLQAANDLGFHFIDVDLAIAEKIHIQHRRCKLIVSHHDFHQTPTNALLHRIKEKMRCLHADIFKIATLCHSEHDARRLLAFLLAKAPHEEMIVLGMGQYGKITRLLAPLCGAYLTFASQDNQLAALGHAPYQQLLDFYSKFELLTRY